MSDHEPKREPYTLFNDKVAAQLKASPNSPLAGQPCGPTPIFHPFPRFPPEIRLQIWEAACLQPRLLSVELYDPRWSGKRFYYRHRVLAEETPLYYSYTTRNKYGKLVSRGAYHVRVPRCPGDWSKCLQYVSREANEGYRSVYRIALPVQWSLPPRSRGRRQDPGEVWLENSDCQVVRINPDMDTVILWAPSRQEISFPWPLSRNQLGYTGSVVAFLYDAWAHDPRSIGITHVAIESFEHDLEHLPSTPPTPAATDHATEGEDKPVSLFGEAAENEEVMSGMRSYFSGFGDNNNDTHTFYALAPLHGLTRYDWDHETLRGASVPIDHYRAMPIFPAAELSQAASVMKVYSADPRPIELESTAPTELESTVPGNSLACWALGPMRTVFHWARFLTRVFGIAPGKVLSGVRYLSMIYPRYVPINVGVMHTRAHVQTAFRKLDEREWEGVDDIDSSEKKLVEAKFKALHKADTGIDEVAGVWVFGPRAFGDILVDDQNEVVMPTKIYPPYVDLVKHKPGLIVLQLADS